MTDFDKPWGNFILKNIVETQTPETISWLPQTLGWQLVLLVIVLLMFKKSYHAFKLYQQNIYRREALSWLKQLQQNKDIDHFRQLPILLRQTALSAFSRQSITTLTGDSWEQWLDQQCIKTNFQQLCPNMLYQIAYAPNIDLSDNKVTLLVEQITLWVKYHRRQDD